MLFADDSDAVAIAKLATPILTTIAVGLLIWLKAQATAKLAQIASSKADVSHKIVGEIKDLAIKTENQTNNRLSELDRKVAAHEVKCIQNERDRAEAARQIAELKLALAEAIRKHQAGP